MGPVSDVQGFSSSVGILAGNARARETENRFGALIDGIRAATAETDIESEKAGGAQGHAFADPRLPGDFISSFAIENPTEADRNARARGEAANTGATGTIDKTSKLYEQALELESFFVKIMLNSMRNTVVKSPLTGKDDFAGKMYDDMLYDELARSVTKGAGFGLADQVYLQLSRSPS